MTDTSMTGSDTLSSTETAVPLAHEEGQALKTLEHGLADILVSGMVYYERLPMLEVVFDRFIRLMTTSMRNFTSDNVEFSLVSLKSLRFSDYLETIDQESLLSVFTAKEWENQGIVVTRGELIFSLIEVLLGGRRSSSSGLPEARPYTSIERTLIEKMVYTFLSDLSTAFDPISPVSFRFDRLEINAKFATIARPANAVIIACFKLQTENHGGLVELVLPYATIEPVRELLLQNFMGEKFGRDNIWENHLAGQLMETDLQLSAILDEISLNLNEVLDWKVGSQITLNATPDSPIKLMCGEHTLFTGHMGQKAGSIAVRIEDVLLKYQENQHVITY